MTQEEFKRRLSNPTPKISPDDWKAIETVYMYHPAIDPRFGKDQIANLYSTFGMGVIISMLPEAKAWERQETRLTELVIMRSKISEVIDNIMRKKKSVAEQWNI